MCETGVFPSANTGRNVWNRACGVQYVEAETYGYEREKRPTRPWVLPLQLTRVRSSVLPDGFCSSDDVLYSRIRGLGTSSPTGLLCHGNCLFRVGVLSSGFRDKDGTLPCHPPALPCHPVPPRSPSPAELLTMFRA
jgi:hypothetical protein